MITPPIDQLIPQNQASVKATTVGQSFLTSSFKRLYANSNASILNSVDPSKLRLRYGFYDPSNGSGLTIAPALGLQATNYVKRVTLVGFQGNFQIYEADKWLRVYREYYVPSTNDAYIKLRTTKYNPLLPSNTFTIHNLDEGLGSLPSNPQDNAQYVLLWLRWDGVGGETGTGGISQYGAMFDYYSSGSSAYQPVDLDQDPKRSSGYTKSGTTNFSTTGLNTYSNAGINGLYLLDLDIGGGSKARFFLRDHHNDRIPIKQGSKSISLNVPNIVKDIATYGKGSIILNDNADPTKIFPPGAGAGISLPNGLGLSTTHAYSKLILKKNDKQYPIIVDQNTNDKISIHLKNGAAAKYSLHQTGGKDIVGSGANQNYVEANFAFGLTPNVPKIWEVSPRSATSVLPVVVVDGNNIPNLDNGSHPYDIDNKWVAGFAPTDNSFAQYNAAKNKYWYVLPTQQRVPAGGGCQCQQADVASPGNNFTTPGNVCVRGLHWGKFLKDTVSPRGFSDTQIMSGYISAVNEHAKAENSNRLVTTDFAGYYVDYFVNRADPVISLVPVNFTLADVEGFKGGSLQRFPSSTASNIGGVEKSFPTDPNADTDSTDAPGGGKPIPKDWKKALSESVSKLVEGSAIEKLTPERLSKYLQNQLRQGAPLSDLKKIVLESILVAKVTALQATGMSRKLAIAALKDDPIYQALLSTVNTTKKLTSNTPPGGTQSGSTNSNGKNETQTIRINVVRGLPGYKPNTRPTATVAGQPELVQTYQILKEDKTLGEAPPRRFVFPFVPREVNYSGIGTQWTEIPRSGNYPLVDWTGFNLLKISFNFDIVNMNYESTQGFGLHYSCEDEITKLREMAQTPYPVVFLNMDKFMQNEVRWPLLTSGRGIEFVISEFSVTSVQRTGGGSVGDVSTPNQISRASCSMTLQEIPIETVDIVQMPPIKPCPKKACPPEIPPPEILKKYLLFTSGTQNLGGL